MNSKLILKFPAAETSRPLTYDLIKKFDLELNILKANVNNNMEGTILFEVKGESVKIAEAIEYVTGLGVHADLITSTLDVDAEKCVSCGLCTSVCKIRALTLDKTTWALNFDSSRCISCNRCIPICPARAISSRTAELDV